MAKKNWTDAERKAFGEKMRAARRAKHITEVPPQEENVEPVQASSDNADIGELLKRIKELEGRIPAPQANLESPQLGRGGALIGTYERYNTDPKYYPDPRERLANEKRLQRFGIQGGPIDDYRFELVFETSQSSYETKDGRNVKEPKFTLKLIRVIEDENTGEATDQRYIASQLVFHEDPDTAMSIAQEVGFDFESVPEKTFLDEMRYLRMRDWLIDCYYPVAIPSSQDKRDMVIGNRLVEVFTVSHEEGDKAPNIPFSTFTRKL